MKRKHRRNHHHLVPKSRGGSKADWNLLLIKVERHEQWHKLFGNLTLDEVIDLLQRVGVFKGRHHGKTA